MSLNIVEFISYIALFVGVAISITIGKRRVDLNYLDAVIIGISLWSLLIVLFVATIWLFGLSWGIKYTSFGYWLISIIGYPLVITLSMSKNN